MIEKAVFRPNISCLNNLIIRPLFALKQKELIFFNRKDG